MLTDEDKFRIAKENYKNFMHKTSTSDVLPKRTVGVTVITNSKPVTDYYWSDHDITPTALYQWIKSYNKRNIKREFWAKEVILPAELYNQVTQMIVGLEEPLVIANVVIYKQE